MIILNGIRCETIEQLEEQMTGLSESEKTYLRNDFNGVPNTPITGAILITPRQLRLALVLSGINLQDIEDTINAMSEPQKSITRISWEYSLEFSIDNPLLVTMATLLNLSNDEVKNLFNFAKTL